MLNLSFCLGGKDLGELCQRSPLLALADEMFQQQQFALLLIQPLASGVGSELADGMGESARKNQPGPPTAAEPFKEPVNDKAFGQWLEGFSNRGFAADRIQHQQVGCIVKPHFFLTDPL